MIMESWRGQRYFADTLQFDLNCPVLVIWNYEHQLFSSGWNPQPCLDPVPHAKEHAKHSLPQCHIQNVRKNVRIDATFRMSDGTSRFFFYTHTYIYIFTYIYMYVYLLIICHTYFQMICQKLCRNNLSALRSRYYPSKRLGMAHTLW